MLDVVSLRNSRVFVVIVFIQILDVISKGHLNSFSFHSFSSPVDGEGDRFVLSKLHCNIVIVIPLFCILIDVGHKYPSMSLKKDMSIELTDRYLYFLHYCKCLRIGLPCIILSEEWSTHRNLA